METTSDCHKHQETLFREESSQPISLRPKDFRRMSTGNRHAAGQLLYFIGIVADVTVKTETG